MAKIQKLRKEVKEFNPNAVGSTKNGIFGLPFNVEEAQIVGISAPWGVTVSGEEGTQHGPKLIIDASRNVDLYKAGLFGGHPWTVGFAVEPLSASSIISKMHHRLRPIARKSIRIQTTGPKTADDEACLLNASMVIDSECEKLNYIIKRKTLNLIDNGKTPFLLGGDHGTPQGVHQAFKERGIKYGVLWGDAHLDLRNAYERNKYSHASIMRNILKYKNIEKVVAVGIRDYCAEEVKFIEHSRGRVVPFYNKDIQENAFCGLTWEKQCLEIVRRLPMNVYLSLDIDGFESWLCTGTGTKVPGGYTYDQLIFLIKKIASTGRRIIGFDIVEVSQGENKKDTFNATVGAQLLYDVLALTAQSNNLKPLLNYK